MPDEIYKIADQYWDIERYEDVKLLCEYIAENHSDSDLAIKAKAWAAGADIHLGNDARAQSGIDALIEDFAGDPELAGMLWKLGNISCEGGKYDWAAELYQYVIDNWPKTEHEMRAKTGIAKLNISLGNDAAVEATLDSLIADFNDHPALPEAVFIIGEQYYYKALLKEKEGHIQQAKDYFRKTIALWERIITELPPSPPYTTQAYYFSAVCYRRLGEYENAIEYYQEVVVNWPDYQYACSAQFLIGHIYQDLKNSGTVPGSIADAATTDAYEAVLEKYPDYPAARAAEDWLKYNSRSNEGENK